jgi:tRNA threonylcarbamoyl adenosine modification protein (Sua5/YciO/YrdC/YwlC family)
VSDVRTIPENQAAAEAAGALERGGLIALPTDTLYGIGCAINRPRAIERLIKLRGIDRARRPLTFLLPDLGEIARYAQVSGEGHRILSRILPGPYCVELRATAAVPPAFVVGPRKTIGVRVPARGFCERLLWTLAIPIVTATAKARDGRTLTSASEIAAELGSGLDLIVDGGELEGSPSTVVSLVDDWVTVLRHGRGDVGRLLG